MRRRTFLTQLVALPASARLWGQTADRAGIQSEVPGPVTRVAQIGGVPTFTVDGQPFLEPCFETYVPESHYFEQFARAGTRLFSFSVNAAACDYGHSAPTWTAPDTWDYAQLEQRAERVLAARPDAWLLPRVNLGTPRWWLDAHPEVLERFDDGSTIPTAGGPTLPAQRGFPSLASPAWLRAVGDALRRLIEHVQRSRFGPHVFGWFLAGLHTEEFYHWACSTEQAAGYSPASVAAFRAWLSTKYGDDAALRAAWRRKDVTLENAQVPTRAERHDPGDGVFRDPQRQRNVLDFYAFWNEMIPNTIAYFTRVARRTTQGRKVLGAFYGYCYEFVGDPEFGHNALGYLLRHCPVDFMAVTASYGSRQSGSGGDYARSPAASVRLHGKLWYHDNDVVSFRAREIMSRGGFRDDADWTRNLSLQLRSLGYTETPEASRWMYRRGVGFAISQGMYCSWFDLHGGYFDAAPLMEEIQQLGRLLASASDWDRRSCAQILVVADESACAYAGYRSPLLRQVLLTPQNQLLRLGAPVDHLLLDDLERLDVGPYRLIVFLNAWRLNAAQRRLIQQRLMGQQRHLLWCGAAGWFDERGATPDAAAEFMGIRVRRGDDFREPFVLADEHAVSLPITRDASGPIVALRAQSDWTALWAPTPALPAATFRGLARQAGVHLFNEQDDVLYVNRSLLCLHANGTGSRTLQFPHEVTLIDAVHRRQVANHVRQWSTDLTHGETILFAYQ